MSRPAQSRARDKAIPATTGFYLASRHLLVRKAGSGPRKSPLAGFLLIWLIFATEGIGRRCDRHASILPAPHRRGSWPRVRMEDRAVRCGSPPSGPFDPAHQAAEIGRAHV